MVFRLTRLRLLPLFFFAAFLIVLGGFFVPQVTHAQGSSDVQRAIEEGVQPIEDAGFVYVDPRLIIANIIRVFLGFVGILMLALITYAGYLWLLSQGSEEQITRAKDIMKNAAIGLLIILSAFAIVSFILNLLTAAINGGNGGAGDDATRLGRGALGAGIIQSHYPARDARDVPRNTNIVITFKVPMDLASFTTFTDTDGTPGRTWRDTYTVIPEAISIFRTAEPETMIGARVYTLESEFNDAQKIRTIVLDPAEYLGSPSENQKHRVALKEPVRTYAQEKPFRLTAYTWEFETNTTLDFTPPQVLGMKTSAGYPDGAGGQAKPAESLTSGAAQNSAYPNRYVELYNGHRLKAELVPYPYETIAKCDTTTHTDADKCEKWARNVLVQLNFTEAVNPLTVAGTNSFAKVLQWMSGQSPEWREVAGEFRLSSDYRTIEFWPRESAGVNSCGNAVYVLPGDARLRVVMTAASPIHHDVRTSDYSPQAPYPWGGMVDMADNALDGNADGYATAKGTGESADAFPVPGADYDDVVWLFDTSNTIDITSPIVIDLGPDDHAEFVGERDSYDRSAIEVEWSKLLSATSLSPNDAVYMQGKEDPADPDSDVTTWSRCLPNNCPVQGSLVTAVGVTPRDSDGNGRSDHHISSISHELLQRRPATLYNPVLSQKILDIYQNCYEGACYGVATPQPQSADADYEPGTPPVVDPANPLISDCRAYLPNPLP